MRRSVIVIVWCLLAASAAAGCSLTPAQTTPAAVATSDGPATTGAVSSSDPLATAVGIDVLSRGGNAVDAAVAVAFAEAVTYPAAGNIGGGGFMLVRMPDGRSTAIDYRETAPGAATTGMYQDADGDVIPGASTGGHRAVAVPGTVAGMALALRRFGTMSWSEVLEPARRLADEGFPADEAFVEHDPPAPLDGYEAGDTVRQPELAATLARLQRDGWQEFYRGETAGFIAAAMQRHGGLISLDDLARYRAVARRPLRGAYRDCRILTMPPPSTGGFTLLETLNMLERLEPDGGDPASAQHEYLMVESLKHVFADRSRFAGDPAFFDVPVEGLTSRRHAVKQAAAVDPDTATPADQIAAGDPSVLEKPQTTHFSVVDADGGCVANTYTLNGWYGSDVYVPEAGFFLNDEMDDFTAKAGEPNQFGLIQGEGNLIEPGKRPASSMTPTIVVRDGRPFLVLGSPGGPVIITSVLQVLVNVIDGRMSLAQAVAAPRLHHQWQPDETGWEEGVPESVRQDLGRKGETFSADPTTLGDVQAIMILPSGELVAVSDGRSGHPSAVAR